MICDKNDIDNDAKVRDHGHISGKYRSCLHRDCNIDIKLNHKISVVFHDINRYHSQGFIEELGKRYTK